MEFNNAYKSNKFEFIFFIKFFNNEFGFFNQFELNNKFKAFDKLELFNNFLLFVKFFNKFNCFKPFPSDSALVQYC